MLFLEAVSLHASCIRTVTGPGAVYLVLPPVKAVTFILAAGPLGFYLGCSFAPNHKGMPILMAPDKSDFL